MVHTALRSVSQPEGITPSSQSRMTVSGWNSSRFGVRSGICHIEKPVGLAGAIPNSICGRQPDKRVRCKKSLALAKITSRGQPRSIVRQRAMEGLRPEGMIWIAASKGSIPLGGDFKGGTTLPVRGVGGDTPDGSFQGQPCLWSEFKGQTAPWPDNVRR